MRAAILLFLLGIFVLPLGAQDKPVVALKGDYRNDPFWNFAAGRMSWLKSSLDAIDKLPPTATQVQKDKALQNARMGAVVLRDQEVNFLYFCGTTKLPPKAAAIIAPLIEYMKRESFQRGREKLLNNLETADIQQLQDLYQLFDKIPWPSNQRMGEYIDEAYFQGEPTSHW